jgi:hypothetical protein
MRSSTTLLRSVAVVAALASLLSAQTTRSLPAHADLAEGHHGLSMPFGVEGFRTQLLVDADAAGPTGSVLTGIRFRADRPQTAQPAFTVPNVTVTLSHSSAVIGNMDQQFAVNVTGTTTQVFSGSVTMPAQPEGFAGPQAWDLQITFAQPYTYTAASGSLLIDIVGNNPAQATPQFSLDAMGGGGAATAYGTSGDDPSSDNLRLNVSIAGVLDTRLLSPGHAFEFNSMLTFTQPPGVLALGLTGFPAPVDLGPLGAPTNSLYIDPLVLSVHNWQSSFIGRYSTYTLPVPNNALLIGTMLYGQSVLFEPAANPLGLILSHAVEVRIGDQAEQPSVQQLDANDPTATSGTMVDFGQGDLGAVAILLEGVFF